MAKLFILLSLILLQACSVEAQLKNDETDRADGDLLGPVRTIRIENLNLSKAGNKSVDSPRSLSQIITYNIGGYKTEDIKYNLDGSVASQEVFNRDNSGRVKEVIAYDGNGSILGRKEYSFDASGGREEIAHYNSNGSLLLKDVRIYDENGRRTRLITYNANNIPLNELSNIYDSSGKLTGLLQKVNGAIVSKSRLNDEKNRTEITNYSAEDVLVGKTVIDEVETGKQTEVYEYDANGALIGTTTFLRELDSYGNWTKQTRLDRNTKAGESKIVEVTYRTITYY
jgi:YD repeat-containing protein